MQELLLIVVACVLAGISAKASRSIWDREQIMIGVPALCIGIVLCVLVTGGATAIQYSVDHYNKLTFYQYLNGVELSTEMVPTTCTKDGACFYTYRSAPFTETYTDSHGPVKTRAVYHSCPYVTEEDAYLIHTSVGDITVAQHRFPAHYQAWDLFEPIPADIVDQAGVGVPTAIVDANEAIQRGDPRPATVISSYTNYILVSDNILVTVSSSDLDRYRQAHLLPDLSTSVVDSDQAKKVQFAGLDLPDEATWQAALMRLNMEAGGLSPATSRFDIQLVLVNSSLVPTSVADDYTRALNAYWESPTFGKGALPKNMAVVVAGTDGKSVTWARGFTLIPTGNGVLWQDLQSFLPGTLLTPQTVLGWPSAVLSTQHGNTAEQRVRASSGKIEQIVVLGAHHFVRQHMTDRHAGSVGYSYLEGDIQPGFWLCLRFVLVALVFGLLLANGWYLFICARHECGRA